MRQWMVPPQVMCDQHLLGEHVEHHMFVGTILKGVSVAGYIEGGLLQPETLQARHDELVAEMEARGMVHRSPLQEHPPQDPEGYIDVDGSLAELAKRCPDCRRWQERFGVAKFCKESK